MMNVFNPALSILIEITQGKKTFHNSIKEFFADVNHEDIDKATTSIYVGCVLRHYYVLRALANSFNKDVSEPCKIGIALVVANSLFLKRYENSTGIGFLKELFEIEGYELDMKAFKELLERKEQGESLIDADLDRATYAFISQRYNLPEWLAKMWSNNFSRNITYKIARSMTKNPVQYLRINTLLTDKEKMLGTYPEELQACDFSEDMLLYTGKDHVRRKKYVITNKMFQLSAGVKEMIDSLPIHTYKPCVVYSGNYNLVPLELAIKFNNELKIENLTTPNNDMFIFKNNLDRYHAKSVRTSECTITQLVTAISDKVAMLILMPKSSAFDRLRIDPDYFLTFDRNSLDDLIENQNILIDEAAQFIEDNGYLVYAVPTIDKKEGQNVISNFMKKHHEFELVKEVQHFPQDETNSVLYYAILRKREENE